MGELDDGSRLNRWLESIRGSGTWDEAEMSTASCARLEWEWVRHDIFALEPQ